MDDRKRNKLFKLQGRFGINNNIEHGNLKLIYDRVKFLLKLILIEKLFTCPEIKSSYLIKQKKK